MSAEDTIEALRKIDFKEINSACSKQNINLRVDDFARRKFEKALSTAHLLITQPIEIAITKQTKSDSLQALRDVKKVFDSVYLSTKDQKYKAYSDYLNELMTHSKLK